MSTSIQWAGTHDPDLRSASPGPWDAISEASECNGAVLIVDAHNEIIGWATDKAGHTTERCLPDRRHRDAILANAVRIAAVPEMLDLLRAVVAGAPAAIASLKRHGEDPPSGLVLATLNGRALLQRLGALP